MKLEKLERLQDYVKALFELEFKPLYGDYVYCEWGRYEKFIGWIFQLRCCICTDIDGERDEDKDWIIELHLHTNNPIRVNTKHPDYEEMKEYLDDFIEEITQHI